MGLSSCSNRNGTPAVRRGASIPPKMADPAVPLSDEQSDEAANYYRFAVGVGLRNSRRCGVDRDPQTAFDLAVDGLMEMVAKPPVGVPLATRIRRAIEFNAREAAAGRHKRWRGSVPFATLPEGYDRAEQDYRLMIAERSD